jgi:UDPglucose--hexose-1-phosphate uridylyltransferase
MEDMMPELRKDPVTARWVIISTARGNRPFEFKKEKEKIDPHGCPFCEGNESMTPPEILAYRSNHTKKDDRGWWVRVVPNKYPALQIEGCLNRSGEGMYDKMTGIGAHEVIIETPYHDKDITDLDNNFVEDIIWTYRDRILDLQKDQRFEYVLIFKNKGYSAGASLSHPHSQLIAMPIIPKRVKEELFGAKHYYDYKERCVFCDMVNEEKNSYKRVVFENESFIAFCPFASRFPFEVWIVPKKHETHFSAIHKHQVIDCASILKTVLKKLEIVLEKPAYNYIIHNSPLKAGDINYYHWHIEVIPKLTKIAGFEWGTGFYINPTPPEQAAEFLRNAK